MDSSQILHLVLFALPLMIFVQYLPEFSMRRPVTLAMILSFIVLFGIGALMKLPVELMPNYSYGNVTVFVDVRGGMPPPEIERLVTKPIEEAMSRVSGLRNLISSSKKDRAVVTLEFEPGRDMDLAALEVREKFLRVKPKLPKEIEKPIISRYEESDAPIVIAALTSKKYTPEQLRRIVDRGFKENLMRVDGVANVELGGGRERKIVINLDRNRLALYNISIHQVVSVLEKNNLIIKAGEVSGESTFNLGVRALGSLMTIDDIRLMPVQVLDNQARVRVQDLGSVEDSFLEHESYSRLNTKDAVTIYVQKETVANTVKTAGLVDQEIEKFKKTLDKDIDLVVITNHKQGILSAIASVRMTLLYGIALVLLVLSIFLCKTPLTRFFVVSLLVLFVGNIILFFVMRWNLEYSFYPVVLMCIFVAVAAYWRVDLRSALVVAFSIPISVLMTLAFMFVQDVSLNVMSLSGLVLGIGLLVDNAVVVVENYDRLVFEHPDWPLSQVMQKAAGEMVPSILGGTLTTVVVFLPFTLLQKQTQVLFSGISFAVTSSLFSSLFVSLSVVPVLASLIDPKKIKPDVWDEKIVRFFHQIHLQYFLQKFSDLFSRNLRRYFKNVLLFFLICLGFILYRYGLSIWQSLYVPVAFVVILLSLGFVRHYDYYLSKVLFYKRFVILGAGALFLGSILIFLFDISKDFMSSTEQKEFVIFVELDTGMRLDISNKVVSEVEEVVRNYKPVSEDIKNISSKVEGWSSKIYVTLKDVSDRQKTTQQVIDLLRQPVNKVMEKYSAQYQSFAYFSEPRSGKEIFVEIYGYDYDLMATHAMTLAQKMEQVPGLSDVKIRYRPGRPQISVKVDSLQAAILGLDTQMVADNLHAQMRGLRATTFYDQEEEVETVVRLNPEQRETSDQLRNLFIPTSHHQQVMLDQLAKLDNDLSPSEIYRRNKSRMVQVSANLGKTSLESAAKMVQKEIDTMDFPKEYYAQIGGEYQDLLQANQDFWKALFFTIFLVFMVMACQFESLSKPLVLMSCVGLSLIGVVVILSLFKTMITMGVFIGFLMLGGIVVNNGIMLIDCARLLQRDHPALLVEDLVIEAGKQRVRPIFMTTSTTILGLMPMAIDRSESAALWSPLALTVIGGLTCSTILTLFVVPAVYVFFEQFIDAAQVYGWRNVLIKKIVGLYEKKISFPRLD